MAFTRQMFKKMRSYVTEGMIVEIEALYRQEKKIEAIKAFRAYMQRELGDNHPYASLYNCKSFCEHVWLPVPLPEGNEEEAPVVRPTSDSFKDMEVQEFSTFVPEGIDIRPSADLQQQIDESHRRSITKQLNSMAFAMGWGVKKCE